MRVRIRKDIDDGWVVESKYWYNFHWVVEKYTIGDDAEKRALRYAQNLINPTIIELNKPKPRDYL
jgi:hypothetical protein